MKPLALLAAPLLAAPLLAAPLLLAVLAFAPLAASYGPCSDTHAVVFVPFPAAVPTPGGHMATGVYYDDRPSGNLVGLVPVGNGFVRGEGTWIYLETNGQPGLQRGGVSTLPTLKVAVIGTGANDPEICSGQSTTPDELVF